MPRIDDKWWYLVSLGGRKLGYQARIAEFFRRLASRIDGRITIAITMKSDPEVSMETKCQCINRGFKLSEKLFIEEVKLQSIERGYRNSYPEHFHYKVD